MEADDKIRTLDCSVIDEDIPAVDAQEKGGNKKLTRQRTPLMEMEALGSLAASTMNTLSDPVQTHG
eukprot:scaffold220539_cov23-Prasinocladus_malaysianus.AAC.2